MALARGLLLWLPLERLLSLRLYAPTLVSDDLFVQRLLLLNRLQTRDLDPGDSGLDLLDRYIRLTTLQGELSSAAPLFVSPQRLAQRAIFLREPAWHRLFSDLQEETTTYSAEDFTGGYAVKDSPLEALYSGSPEIQARELARVAIYLSRAPNPTDPRDLPWTAGLQQAVRYALLKAGIRASRLFGFTIEEAKIDQGLARETKIGFLMARMLSRNPFTIDSVADNLGLSQEDEELAGYYANAGSFQPIGRPEGAGSPRLAAFEKFDVRAIQILLQNNPGRVFSAEQYSHWVPDPETATASYPARRAYALYKLAEAESRLQLGEPYVEQIRVLAGLPAEPTLAGRFGQNLRYAMLSLAHPSAQAEDVEEWFKATRERYWPLGEISYDLPHLMAVVGDRKIPPGLVGLLTNRLYARGQLLSGYGNPSIFAEVQAYGLPAGPVALSLAYLDRLQKYGRALPRKIIRTTSAEQLTGLAAAYRLQPAQEQALRQTQKDLDREYWKLYQMIASAPQP